MCCVRVSMDDKWLEKNTPYDLWFEDIIQHSKKILEDKEP